MESQFFNRAVGFSLALHFLFLVSVGIIQKMDFSIPKPEPQWIEVEFLKNYKNRIVKTDAGQKTEKAPEDAYLGKENRVVKKQTTAKTTGDSLLQKPAQKKVEKSINEEINKGALSKFGVPILPATKFKDRQKDRPQWAKHAQISPAENDLVKGIDQADSTALNTKEYVYFGYFERIRKRLNLAWKPILREEILRFYNKGRRLASEKDHTTKTIVVLDSHGEIVEVHLLEASGTQSLDKAAVRAFNKAGPFPNPPQGLVDRDGKVTIRWDFVLRT